MRWWHKSILNPKYKDYADSVHHLKKSNTPLSEQKFVVIDTETTGLDVKTDQILTIGIVPIVGYEICVDQTAEWTLPLEHSSKGGHAIHEILERDISKSLPASQVLEQFLEASKGAIIIGHHIAFDVNMLNKHCVETLQQEVLNPYYDTNRMYERLYKDFSSQAQAANSLDAICDELGITIEDRHTALGDASATALLFMRLLKRLESRGVKTVKDLFRR